MKHVTAQNLVRRLRSNGVKVYLGQHEEVCFSSLEGVTGDVKMKIMEHGRAIKAVLQEEAKVRAFRKSLKKPVPAIPDVPDKEL